MNKEALNQFADALRNADLMDDGLFRDLLVKGMELFSLSDKEIAREFDASRPTVTRWRNGDNAPHPSARKHIYGWMQKKAALGLRRIADDENRRVMAAISSPAVPSSYPMAAKSRR